MTGQAIDAAVGQMRPTGLEGAETDLTSSARATHEREPRQEPQQKFGEQRAALRLSHKLRLNTQARAKHERVVSVLMMLGFGLPDLYRASANRQDGSTQ